MKKINKQKNFNQKGPERRKEKKSDIIKLKTSFKQLNKCRMDSCVENTVLLKVIV